MLVLRPCLLQLAEPLSLPKLMLLNCGIVLPVPGFVPRLVSLPRAGQKLVRAAKLRRPEVSRVRQRCGHG